MKTRLYNHISGLVLVAAMSFGAPALADGMLDRGVGSERSSLNPHINFDAAAGWIQLDAYEGLVTFDSAGQVIPGAAESWTVSDDGMTYTFTLRKGLKWSNGDPLIAQDFVNGALRTLDPATGTDKGYYFYSVIQIRSTEAMAFGEATDPATLGITAPDDRTVVVEMLTPAPHIPDIMAGFAFSPLHAPSFAAHGPGVFIDPALVVTNGA